MIKIFIKVYVHVKHSTAINERLLIKYKKKKWFKELGLQWHMETVLKCYISAKNTWKNSG